MNQTQTSRTGTLEVLFLILVTALTLSVSAEENTAESLRTALVDLGSSFPTYPAKDYLSRLESFEKRRAGSASSSVALDQEFATLQREALLANPLLTRQPILFVARWQYAADHHNTETIFVTGECNTGSYRGGGTLKTFNPATGKVRLLVDAGPDGLARDPDVHFDGQHVLFSMRKNRPIPPI